MSAQHHSYTGSGGGSTETAGEYRDGLGTKATQVMVPVLTEEQKVGSLNDAFTKAIGARKLAETLGLQRGSEPRGSEEFSRLLGGRVFVQKGFDQYRSIKGHAAMGYFWDLISTVYDELLRMSQSRDEDDIAALRTRRKEFLNEHGISHPNGLTTTVSLMHLAIWEALKDRTLVVPSSGSFANGFLQTYEALRNLEVTMGGTADHKEVHRFKLLRPQDCKVHVWLPDIGCQPSRIDPEKLGDLSRAADTIGATVRYWKEDRDFLAFLDALNADGFYCSTNLQTEEEVADLAQRALDRHGKVYFDSHRRALERHGIFYEAKGDKVTKIVVEKPMIGSMYGLMGAQLEALEVLCSLFPDSCEEWAVYNQASAGATLAATVVVNTIFSHPELLTPGNRALLARHYPNINAKIQRDQSSVRLKAQGVFAPENPKLAITLGYKLETDYFQGEDPSAAQAPNGLWSSSSGAQAGCLLKMASHYGGFNLGQESMLVCPRGFMEIARLMLFAEEIRRTGSESKDIQCPESAGAAGLGGVLHRDVLAKKVRGYDVAYFLRSNGVNAAVFMGMVREEVSVDKVKIVTEAPDRLRKEAESFGSKFPSQAGVIKEFTEEFLEGMDLSFDTLTSRRTPESATKDAGGVQIINMTGSNGQQAISSRYAPVIAENQQTLARQLKEATVIGIGTGKGVLALAT